MIKVIIAIMILALQAYPQFDEFGFFRLSRGHRSTTVLVSDTTPPEIPQNLLATGAVLTWTANTEPDLQGYVVYRDSLGVELVTNGGFDSDIDWSYGGQFTISGGVANLVCDGTYSSIYQQIPVIIGRNYNLTFNAVLNSGTINVYEVSDGTTPMHTIINGINSIDFVADASDEQIIIKRITACNATIDNVSVKEIITSTTHPDIPIDTVLAGTETYTDLTAVSGTTYNYRIRSFDITGNLSDYSNNAIAIIP